MTASRRTQRWRDRRHGWVPTSAGGFDPSRYEIVELDLPTARDFVHAHHYSGSYPADRFRFGLVHHDPREATARELVGVAVYGVPASARVLTNPLPDLEPFVESIELSRLVLLDGRRAPANAESFFVARCHRRLLQQGVRAVVSFCDPVPRRVDGRLVMPGHVGIVYQALGATYTGRATARTLALLPDGRVLSARSAQKVRAGESGAQGTIGRLVQLGARRPRPHEDMAVWLRRELEHIGARRVRHGGNHRYVFRLGRTAAQRREVRVALESRPYPKAPDVG